MIHLVWSGPSGWLGGPNEKGTGPAAETWREVIGCNKATLTSAHVSIKEGRLPTKINLAKRGCMENVVCCRCGAEVETTEHCLRDCWWGKVFWKLGKLRIEVEGSKNMGIQDWILLCIRGKPEHWIQLFCYYLWSAWKLRNEICFEGRERSPWDGVNLGESMLADFQNSFERAIESEVRKMTITQWQPPAEGGFKLNVDAAVVKGRSVGIGGLIRDHKGDLIKLFAEAVQGEMDVVVAEAKACLVGILLAKDLGIKKLLVESDNLSLIGLLNKKDIPFLPIGTIVSDILHIAGEFESISFEWIGRQANSCAHFLAGKAKSREDADEFRFVPCNQFLDFLYHDSHLGNG